MLTCPARIDLISLPCNARPASNFSSRKYSNPALRLVATTFTFSVINLYYHNQYSYIDNGLAPLEDHDPCQKTEQCHQEQRARKPDEVRDGRSHEGTEQD